MPDLINVLSPVLAGFCIISALITYSLGMYVFARNASSAVNRLYLVLTLATTYWALDEFLLWRFASDEGCFMFWLKAGAFWIFVIALATHFTLVFTDHPLTREKKHGILLAALYLPALLFALVGLFTDLLVTVTFQPGTGYVHLPAFTSPVYLVEKAYITLAIGWVIYTGISSWLKAPPGRKRRQNLLFCIGIITAVGLSILSELVLTPLGIYTVNATFIGIGIFSLLIAYAILRHRLFTLSPQTAADDIVRTIPEGLILVDAEGRIVTANASAAEIFGVAESGLVGQPITRFIPDTVCTAIRTAVAKEGRVSDIEVTHNGRGSTICIAGALVRNPAGEPAGIVLIARDITDQKAAETALRTANQKLSLLSQVTCHDIGNEITGLAWHLTLLSEDRMHPDAETHLSRSIEIVEDIKKHLQFSREYQTLGTYQPIWQPLEPMITRAIGSMHLAKVDISTRVAPVEIYADPLAQKVAYNLIENAIQHGSSVTRICISTDELADGTLTVVFEDDGAGVPDDEKERIFRYGHGKNTGFGLAFARDILSVTDIRIHETGTAGRGARFEILVPPGAWRPLQGD